jgi:hypothetical protein
LDITVRISVKPVAMGMEHLKQARNGMHTIVDII